jgi:hypothetical protein
MKLLKSGKLWPYAIGGAISLVFSFAVITVIVTAKADIQKSDAYMTYYQDADENINDYINEKILFDKKYNIKFLPTILGKKGALVQYKVTDTMGNPVDNASMILAISRPETEIYNKTIKETTVKNGLYTFKDVTFPKVGLWNLILKVSVGKNSRFYNVKIDTRTKKVKVFQ